MCKQIRRSHLALVLIQAGVIVYFVVNSWPWCLIQAAYQTDLAIALNVLKGCGQLTPDMCLSCIQYHEAVLVKPRTVS